MPTGSLPGMAYEDMYALIEANKQPAAHMFSCELLIAIFWEESLFNNIEQIGGTAWGFGQVEPSEMYKLEGESADRNKYLVKGLPGRVVLKRDENGVPIVVRLQGRLTPEQSVQVSAGILTHYYHTVGPSVFTALCSYAGVKYAGGNVPKHLSTGSSRIAIIHGWLECEAYLKKEWKPNMFNPPDKKAKKDSKGGLPHSYEAEYTRFIKAALHKARKFDLEDKLFDDALFPNNSVNEAGERVWRPQRTPKWLTDLAARNWQ